MNYRLYRRNPIKKDKWYYAVTCKNCKEPICILDDNSQGTNPVSIIGDGEISTACMQCTHEDLYKSKDIFVYQATADLDGPRPNRVPKSNSPRKPIWKTYPKAKVTFGIGYIEDRPEAASIVGRIITGWADIEVTCARLLAELIGATIPSASALFGSLRSSRTQFEGLNAVAEITLTSKDKLLFDAHMARRSELEKERNDLAHGCFGVSLAIPDHIIWVSQKDMIAFNAAHKSSSKSDYREKFRRKQFVYELGTLERIAQEIEELYHQIGQFTGYLVARHHGQQGAAFRAIRYDELCNQNHIREKIEKIKKSKSQKKLDLESSYKKRVLKWRLNSEHLKIRRP